MRARLTLQLLFCGLALQFNGVAQAAGVIFDNGASNQEDGWEMTQLFEADDFVVVENRAVLSGVKFWNYAKSGAFTGSVTWEIYTNSPNGPGQLLASGMSQASSHTQTGFVMFGTLFEAVTTFELPSVTLNPGTYWLALHNGPPEYTTRGMFWAPTGKRNSSGMPSHSREIGSRGAWTSNDYPGMASELAFQIFGTGGATATPTPTPTATPSATATPTATAQPSPSPSATPRVPRQLLNIATRVRVQTGDNVLIGGLIVTGNAKKKVIIRAVGPSLSQVFSGALPDTALELYQGQTLLAANDDWKQSQRQEIEQTGIPPSDDRESAIVYTLDPGGSYTAVLSGRDGATGIGVIEVYDLDPAADSRLANIATRGFVETGENVMIGGLIVGGSGNAPSRILLRAMGPSLAAAGVTGTLQDPVMELRDQNGALVRENDDWEDTQRAAIESTTIAPKYATESAILLDLPAGNYTALVRGQNEGVGVGLVEVYNVR